MSEISQQEQMILDKIVELIQAGAIRLGPHFQQATDMDAWVLSLYVSRFGMMSLKNKAWDSTGNGPIKSIIYDEHELTQGAKEEV